MVVMKTNSDELCLSDVWSSLPQYPSPCRCTLPSGKEGEGACESGRGGGVMEEQGE